MLNYIGFFVFLIGFLFYAATFALEYRKASRLDNQGQTTRGTVLRLKTNPGRGKATYTISYKFQDSTGTTHTGEDIVSTEDFDPLQGKEVSVVYLPSDPRVSSLGFDDPRKVTRVFMLVIFGVIAAVWFFRIV